MLTLALMIVHSVPDAPRDAPPPVPLRCTGCQHLATRHHPAGIIGPHGTSARCIAAEGGTRRISWEWQPSDPAPCWCPRRRAGA